MKITNKLIDFYLEKGLITAQSHPEFPELVILNYTKETAYEKKWDAFTIISRGLIFNRDTEEVLSAPFKKFFNYGETPETLVYAKSDIPYSVMNKEDGSLGISYFYGGKVRWATRGSFTSDQAKKAQEIWDNKYSQFNDSYSKDFTLLTEIIYPENRIVVDYKGFEDLILIGINEIKTFESLEYRELEMVASLFGIPLAERFNLTIEEMLEVKKTLDGNKEGFIVCYRDGFRMKIKGDEYVRRHKILTNLSDKTILEIWEHNNKEELENILKEIPEEFRGDYEKLIEEAELSLLSLQLEVIYEVSKVSSFSKKEIVLNEMLDKQMQSLVFLIIDEKQEQYEKIIRKIVSKRVLS